MPGIITRPTNPPVQMIAVRAAKPILGQNRGRGVLMTVRKKYEYRNEARLGH